MRTPDTDHEGLPLFSWQQPAEVIPFPTAKRVGKIRHVAEKLREREGKGREAYWRQITDGIISQMIRAQLEPGTIHFELCQFENSVLAEIRRLEALSHLKGEA